MQEGKAAEPGFQAIVDLVGDKLREVFKIGDIGIRSYEPKANLNHFQYQYEHGMRDYQPPRTPSAGALKLLQTRQPVVVNNPAEYAALGFGTTPGTDQSPSSVAVPLPGRHTAVGPTATANHHRETTFADGAVPRAPPRAAGVHPPSRRPVHSYCCRDLRRSAPETEPGRTRRRPDREPHL